jgi:hypothetical protein
MQSNRDGGNVDGVWQHDRFVDEDEEEEEIVEAPVRGTYSGAGLETGAKLQISNLAFSVSDDDIKVRSPHLSWCLSWCLIGTHTNTEGPL